MEKLVLVGRDLRRSSVNAPSFHQASRELAASLDEKRPRPSSRIENLEVENLLGLRSRAEAFEDWAERLLQRSVR